MVMRFVSENDSLIFETAVNHYKRFYLHNLLSEVSHKPIRYSNEYFIISIAFI